MNQNALPPYPYPPAAIHLLEKNQDCINWWDLSTNPSIFVYDYEEMKRIRGPLLEELIRERLNPKNLGKFEAWGLIFT